MQFDVSLTAEDIAVSRGDRRILSDISLTLAPGEVIIMRGANGVGKTTLLRALAGLITVEQGEIIYGTAPGVEEASVYCGTQNAMKPALSVRENLLFWAQIYKSDAATVETAINVLSLGDYTDYAAGKLSTGYQRRLGLARLLVAGRAVWLVDEPSASLDETAADQFLRQLESHRKRGGSAIIATHDDLTISGARELTLSPAGATS